MKAAYYSGPQKLGISEQESPKPKRGEALIKVAYTGICGSDLHVYHGAHPTAKFPVIPGHEFVGELVDIDPEFNTSLKPGDIVVAQPYFSCGVCEPCITGNDNVCSSLSLMGIHQNGSFAEYAIVPAKKMYQVPKGVDLKLAALTEPLAVAVHDVRRSELKVGQKALIIGGGPIGLFIAMVAKMAGAQVYISEVSQFRIDFAKNLGYEAFNPLGDDFDQQMKEVTKGKGFDVIFEVSGSKSGIESTTKYAKIGGTIMIVGMAGDKYPVDLMTVFLKQLKLLGVRIHSQEAFASALDIITSGILNQQLYQLISRTYPLTETEAAYEYIANHNDYFKILLEV